MRVGFPPIGEGHGGKRSIMSARLVTCQKEPHHCGKQMLKEWTWDKLLGM